MKQTKFFISIGNKCQTAQVLNQLNIRHFSLPFDFIPTLPHLIAKYIKNRKDFFPKFGHVRIENDEMWLGDTTDQFKNIKGFAVNQTHPNKLKSELRYISDFFKHCLIFLPSRLLEKT